MKTIMTILAVVLMTTFGHGQIQSYLTSLKTSEAGITVAELSIIHRSRSDYTEITDLGAKLIIIPNNPNGKKLKIEYYRFITRVGAPFVLNDTTFVPVHVSYDNESNDPRDDIYLLSVPFPIDNELVLEELTHYEGVELAIAEFVNAPNGETNYPIEWEKNKN